MFQVNWPFRLGKEAQNRFFENVAILISHLNNFSYFLIYNKSPQYFLPSFESIGLSVHWKKRKIDFQDGGHSSHLGFPTEIILAIFDLQVAQIFPNKFQSNCLLVQEKKRKIFSRLWPSWISDQNDFSYY